MNNRPKHPNVRRSSKRSSRQRGLVHVRNLVRRQEKDMNKILYPLVIMVLIIIILIYIQNVIIQWNVMEDNYQTNIQMVTDMSLNMSSNRSYRKALDKDIIIEELRRNAGTQFDPELVEPFIEAIQELGGNGRL